MCVSLTFVPLSSRRGDALTWFVVGVPLPGRTVNYNCFDLLSGSKLIPRK